MTSLTCQDQESASLVPLYAAGTLKAPERTRVESHLETCASCRNELKLLREVAADFKKYGKDLVSEHVSSDRLVAYTGKTGQMDRAELRAIERHLEVCHWCSDEVKLLSEFESLQSIHKEPKANTLLSFFNRFFIPSRSYILTAGLSAAAVLLMIGLSIQIYLLVKEKSAIPIAKPIIKQEPGPSVQKQEPQIAEVFIPRFPLQAETATRSLEEVAASNQIKLSSHQPLFLLSFFLAITNEPGIQYDLGIYDGKNHLVTEQRNVHSKDAFGNFEEKFEARLFDTGRYIMKVREIRTSDARELKSYRFPFQILKKS